MAALLSHQEMVGLQAEKHDLVISSGFRSRQEVVLHLMHARAYQELARLAGGRRVLDLGCNTGYGSAILAAAGARRVVGVDVSAQAIAAAQRAHAGERLEFRQVDGGGLPFEDGAFDLVACCQVIEHLVEPRTLLREITRVLGPGGVAGFTTPNAALRLDPGARPWNPFHAREYRHGELAQELAPFFRRVELLGLFAEEPLAAIERQRLASARAIARRRRSLPGRAAVRLEEWAARLGRLVRRGGREGGAGQAEVAAFAAAHGTSELGYRTERLEEALDLLALCGDGAAWPALREP